jgi:uncharacterized protein with ParB-like and HNH nuclease domain
MSVMTQLKISKKIDADDKTLKDILHEQKYTIDYFQREYRWERKHIEQLITDLESAFAINYDKNHDRTEVDNYNSYYLGPMVICEKDGSLSIIDGQQRLTSLTLLLIYIHNLQKDWAKPISIESLVRSEKYGRPSYNLQIDYRKEFLDALFEKGQYDLNGKEESIQNLVERYHDIEELFPEDFKNETVLPFFIDWLKEKVVFVKITSYSDENAYTIFETMNDRGFNLTPTEMLKGYLLSKVSSDQKNTLNNLWKEQINKLHEFDKLEDLEFFRAWLRAKYAESIRPGRAGAANEDFEKIGKRFHTWVKDKTDLLELKKSNDFVDFIKNKFDFFVKIYYGIWTDAENTLIKGMEHVLYSSYFRIASSLAYPLMLAPIKTEDNDKIIRKKLNLSARYLETFAVLRAVNYRTLAQSSIRYTFYSLVKKVRDKSSDELTQIYKKEIKDLDVNFSGIKDFGMHQQNKWFVKFLLARITNFLEDNSGVPSSFEQYISDEIKKTFQVEHKWEDNYDRFKSEFEQRDDFCTYRNKIGGLLLLPKGTNQAFGSKPFVEKLPHYLKQNLLAQSLHEDCYKKNPNFKNFLQQSGLPLKSYKQFKKSDLEERTILYQEICEQIWSPNGFDEIANA